VNITKPTRYVQLALSGDASAPTRDGRESIAERGCRLLLQRVVVVVVVFCELACVYRVNFD